MSIDLSVANEKESQETLLNGLFNRSVGDQRWPEISVFV